MPVEYFFDQQTSTVTYVVSDSVTHKCVIIDGALSYDIHSGVLTAEAASKVIDYVQSNELSVEWILDTHVHADHLTASRYLQKVLGGKVGIGAGVKKVLEHWVPVFSLQGEVPVDGSQFDELFEDGDHLSVGNMSVQVIATPGHTPSCVSYLIKDSIFVGDAILPPKVGCARADFPGGSAEVLYDSAQIILGRAGRVMVCAGHDYPQEGQSPRPMSTVSDHLEDNVMLKKSIDKDSFVRQRNERDSGKAVPKLLYPSIQFNICPSRIQGADSNSQKYMLTPIRNKIV